MYFCKHTVWLLAVFYSGIIDTETTGTDRKTCDSEFASELQRMQMEIDNLKGSNQRLEKEMSKLKTELKESREMVERSNTFEQNRRMLAHEADQHHVAFTASTSVLLNASANATVVFDQVETNVGQAYNPGTGIFTCPYSGNYHFSHSALSSYVGGFLETEIMLEGASKALIYCGDRLGITNETDYDQGSNSVVLSCDQGQRVWVQVYNYNGSTIYNEKFTQFSGFLLWSQ